MIIKDTLLTIIQMIEFIEFYSGIFHFLFIYLLFNCTLYCFVQEKTEIYSYLYFDLMGLESY
jgi:hypothetical protein